MVASWSQKVVFFEKGRGQGTGRTAPRTHKGRSEAWAAVSAVRECGAKNLDLDLDPPTHDATMRI